MERLWAPWRIKYIKGKKEKGCIFCKSIGSKGKNYTVFKTRYSLAMLNIFPYNNGHLMVAPLRHIHELALLKDVEILDLMKSINRAKDLLDQVLAPEGYNIGINLSESAGAGLPDHLHIHIVPRWKADTNFMPVLYNTKIISQSLGELYKQLRNADAQKD